MKKIEIKDRKGLHTILCIYIDIYREFNSKIKIKDIIDSFFTKFNVDMNKTSYEAAKKYYYRYRLALTTNTIEGSEVTDVFEEWKKLQRDLAKVNEVEALERTEFEIRKYRSWLKDQMSEFLNEKIKSYPPSQYDNIYAQSFTVEVKKTLYDWKRETINPNNTKDLAEQNPVCSGKPTCRYVEACGMASCSQCGLIDYYGH